MGPRNEAIRRMQTFFLFDDLSNHTRAYRSSTLADSETLFFFQSYRSDKLYAEGDGSSTSPVTSVVRM